VGKRHSAKIVGSQSPLPEPSTNNGTPSPMYMLARDGEATLATFSSAFGGRSSSSASSLVPKTVVSVLKTESASDNDKWMLQIVDTPL